VSRFCTRSGQCQPFHTRMERICVAFWALTGSGAPIRPVIAMAKDLHGQISFCAPVRPGAQFMARLARHSYGMANAPARDTRNAPAGLILGLKGPGLAWTLAGQSCCTFSLTQRSGLQVQASCGQSFYRKPLQAGRRPTFRHHHHRSRPQPLRQPSCVRAPGLAKALFAAALSF
jgi:hypothetical protein